MTRAELMPRCVARDLFRGRHDIERLCGEFPFCGDGE